MSYKTILVHGGSDPAAEARVKAAMAVGRLFSSAITVAGSETWPPYALITDNGFVSPQLVQLERDAFEERLKSGKAAYERLCAGYEHPHSWREAEACPDVFIDQLARGADLVVAGRPEKTDNDDRFANPSSVVMRAGSPVLLMPSGAATVECDLVLLAWKDTHEARRALADSIPFLKLAKTVVLLQVGPPGTASPGLEDVLQRLRRHGVEVQTDFWQSTKLGDGHDILRAAREHQADLIVAGAYGHSRMREWAFGGVTDTLLHSAGVPVLFSR